MHTLCARDRCGHPWTVRYREPGGSRAERQPSFEKKTQADAFAARLERDKYEGYHFDPQRGEIPLREYAPDWLARQVIADGTWRNYESFLRIHLIPALGDKTVKGSPRGLRSPVHSAQAPRRERVPRHPPASATRSRSTYGNWGTRTADGVETLFAPCERGKRAMPAAVTYAYHFRKALTDAGIVKPDGSPKYTPTVCGTSSPPPPWPTAFRSTRCPAGSAHKTIKTTVDVYGHLVPAPWERCRTVMHNDLRPNTPQPSTGEQGGPSPAPPIQREQGKGPAASGG